MFLIAGGTDKNLDFRPLAEAAGRAAGIYLLAGSATRKIEQLFRAEGIAFEGPFPDLARGPRAAPGKRPAAGLRAARSRRAPPCSSRPAAPPSRLFLNEFDRGRNFKELTKALI